MRLRPHNTLHSFGIYSSHSRHGLFIVRGNLVGFFKEIFSHISLMSSGEWPNLLVILVFTDNCLLVVLDLHVYVG